MEKLKEVYKNLKSLNVIILIAIILIFDFSFILLRNSNLHRNLSNNEGILQIKIASDESQLEPEWFVTWGKDQQEEGRSIEIDSSGNIYIAGFTNSSINKEDFLLIKYNDDGEEQWNFTWGGIGYDVCNDIAIDSSDNIYMVGVTNSYGAGGLDPVLLKVDSSGSLEWNLTDGNSRDDYYSSVVIDFSGNIWAVGINTNPADETNFILKRYDIEGTPGWGTSGSWSGNQYFTGMTLDPNGDIWIIGYNEKTNEILLYRYNTLGVWEKFFHWGFYDKGIPTSVVVDSSLNIFVGGYFYNGVVKNHDSFLMKVNSTGYFYWRHELGGIGVDKLFGVGLDSNENLYFCGSTSSQGQGLEDIFLLKYSNKEGTQLLNATWGGISNDSGLALKIDSSNNIYITGFTHSYGAGSSDSLLLKSPPFYEINITDPWENQFFGTISPTFQIEIDPQFDTRWYTVNDGKPYYFSGTSSAINQTEWDLSDNGKLIIKIYANNSLGDKISGEVPVIKDTIIPNITINSPESDQLFGNSTLNFNLDIIEPNLNTTWYTLNDGYNYEFSGTNGTIDQSYWDLCENGTVSIKFYVNDSAGNVAFEEVVVRKDSTFPIITILSPGQSQLLGINTIKFNLSIISSSIDKRYYSLNGGANYFFSGLNGTINQIAWESCGNGTVSVRFYVNNSAGNTAFEEINVYKDILGPIISILSPIENQSFANDTFGFNLDITEGNLNTTWYSLDDGLSNYTFVGWSDNIDQIAWDDQPEGPLILRFYANDSLGNFGYSEISIIKETTLPIITILTPGHHQLFGIGTIKFNLSIISSSVDKRWYSLNGGIKYFFSGLNGTIDQNTWDACGNGTVSVRFYVNNSAGTMVYDEVTVYKDELSPIISILSPIENQIFGNSTIDFNLTISDGNLYSTWYSLDEGVTNHTFVNSNGSISHEVWGAQPDGIRILRFYANDSLGNLGYSEISIVKDTTPPIIIINYPNTNDIFGYSTINYSLTIFEPNLQSTWYTLNGGLTNHSFSGTTGIINQSLWDDFGNGSIVIRFYARDSIGYLSFNEVLINKDILPPQLTILNPIKHQTYGDIAFDFNITINEPNIDKTWYTLDGGLTNYTFSGLNGTINQGAWDNCMGEVLLRFYVKDSAGNIVFKEVTIFKSLSPKNAYAIIIGISNYPGTSDDLTYCRSDAITMHTMLRAKYNFLPTNMILLTDSEATRTAIINAFTTMKNQMSSEDVFFFYYSGHGGEASSSLHFICPYDSIPSNPSKYIYDVELDILLDQLPGDTQFVMIDACNSGGFIPEVQAANRFIMTACKGTQLSWETSELKHGVFTYYFVDSIFVAPDSNGDGVYSMEEQFSYASSETTSYMLGWGELQQPTKYDGILGQAVLYPSIGALNLVPIGNELHYSFTIYGHGILNSLNITVSSVYQNTSIKVVDIRYASPSSTGFGHYSGIIQLENGLNVSGYEIIAEIQGYNLITFKEIYGDTDNDGLYDILEIKNNMNPGTNDTDGDGISDYDEYYGITNPLINDTDGDGMLDGYEIFNDLNPLQNDALSDYDGDGLNNILEYLLGSLANDIDTDNDGIYDGYEFYNNLEIFIDDANLDFDADTLTNLLEFQIESFANNSDSDNDKMPDGWEYNNNLILLIDDASLDPDADGLNNLEEFQLNTNPQLEDTDGDTWLDGEEVRQGTDPLDPNDFPQSDNTISGYFLL